MFNVILAMDNNFGIGYKNQLPWQFSKDMKFFRTTTINKHFFRRYIIKYNIFNYYRILKQINL